LALILPESEGRRPSALAASQRDSAPRPAPPETPRLRGSPIRTQADTLPARAAFDAGAPIYAAACVRSLWAFASIDLRLRGAPSDPSAHTAPPWSGPRSPGEASPDVSRETSEGQAARPGEPSPERRGSHPAPCSLWLPRREGEGLPWAAIRPLPCHARASLLSRSRWARCSPRLRSDSGKTRLPLRGGWAFTLAALHPGRRAYARAHTLINPFPNISLELVTKMKAWGSAVFRYSRSATAWDRDSAVSTTHFGSWE
jgi:hypothetical protein